MIEAQKEREGFGFRPYGIPIIESNIQNTPNITPDIPKEIVLNLVKINGEKATKIYQKINLLGKGGFAQCFLTKQKESQRELATKVIPKKLLDSHRTKLRLANEIKLHKALQHQNIVQFYNNFEDDENVYINLEPCKNGCMNDILKDRYSFSVPQVQSFTYGICQGLKYIHSRKIIHRDLKLGNIFIDQKYIPKIGDFGLACKLQFAKEYKRTICGTPNYIAPQVLEGKGYHYEVDVWAVGVIIYTLFYTIPPFETEEPYTTYQKIKKCQYQIPRYSEAPLEAIDLIKKILVCNPADRLTIDQILESPFMKLGGSIPLGLPPSTATRAPTKKQFQNWRSISTRDEMKSQMNKTVFGFLGFSKKTVKNSNELTLKQIGNQKNLEEPSIFCRNLDEIENSLITFYLNNGNYGIYDSSTNSVYTCQLRDSKMIESVKKTYLNSSGISMQEQIQIHECPYRMILNLKQKQLLKGKSQVIPCDLNKGVTVCKVNVYRDVVMARLSNRSIQVLFKDKDGFIVSSNLSKIQYFYSFEDFDKGKEVIISSILTFGEKENQKSSTTISSIFKTKNEKHHLSCKKISYLKGILGQRMARNSRKCS